MAYFRKGQTFRRPLLPWGENYWMIEVPCCGNYAGKHFDKPRRARLWRRELTRPHAPGYSAMIKCPCCGRYYEVRPVAGEEGVCELTV